MITRDKALDIVKNHIKNKNLIKHCLAVEAAMRGLARYFSENEELWGIVGLLHDADWEVTEESPQEHTLKVAEWIQEAIGKEDEFDNTIIKAIQAHNWEHSNSKPPLSILEWSVYCCDELTGLIIACALVLPEKKLASVTVESVLKKFPKTSFASGVKREQIALCKEKLGIPLERFINIVLSSMQNISEDLGL